METLLVWSEFMCGRARLENDYSEISNRFRTRPVMAASGAAIGGREDGRSPIFFRAMEHRQGLPRRIAIRSGPNV